MNLRQSQFTDILKVQDPFSERVTETLSPKLSADLSVMTWQKYFAAEP